MRDQERRKTNQISTKCKHSFRQNYLDYQCYFRVQVVWIISSIWNSLRCAAPSLVWRFFLCDISCADQNLVTCIDLENGWIWLWILEDQVAFGLGLGIDIKKIGCPLHLTLIPSIRLSLPSSLYQDFANIAKYHLGTPVCTIIDEFLEKFQKGGGHFRSRKFRCKIFSIRDANLGGSFPFQKIS